MIIEKLAYRYRAIARASELALGRNKIRSGKYDERQYDLRIVMVDRNYSIWFVIV
jgi:hypothetical protein